MRTAIERPARGILTVAFALAAVSVSCPAGIAGQEQGLFILDLPTSAAAAALGDAHPLFGSADNAIFAHPGLLAEGSGFGAFFAEMAGGDIRHYAASASGEWWHGGVGIGIQTVNMVGNLQPTPLSPMVDPSPDVANASQSMVSVGYAREVFGSVNVGAVVKLIEVRAQASEDRMAAVDIGASTVAGPVALALTVQGLGPDPSLGSLTSSVDPRLALGAATRRSALGPLDVAAAGALILESDGDFTPGAGVEVSWWPITGRRFIGRVGLQRLPDVDLERSFTIGGGFEGDDLALEYAYRGLTSELSGAHRFGVRWR